MSVNKRGELVEAMVSYKLYISYVLAKWSWKCASLVFEGKRFSLMESVCQDNPPGTQSVYHLKSLIQESSLSLFIWLYHSLQ